jgi:hypothetical protein
VPESFDAKTASGLSLDGTKALSSEDTLRFLLDAGEALSSSLDYNATLATLARQAVPAIADWCAVDLLGDDGVLRRLAVAHRDPAKIELVGRLEREYPERPDSPTGAYARLRAGRTQWVPEITDALLVEGARDAQHLEIIRTLGLRSYISAPRCCKGARSDC